MEKKNFTKKDIQELLSHISGTDINKAYEVLTHIWNSSTSGEKAIKLIFELSETIDSDNSFLVEERIDNKTEERLLAKYSRYIFSYLRLLVDSRPSVDLFYAQLWKFINEDQFLQSEESKVLAFSLIWNDMRIPYYDLKISGKMSDDEFLEIRNKISSEIAKARFVVFSNFEQKTERTACLLNILEKTDGEKEKQVLLAAILAFLENRLSRIDDKDL